MKKILSVVFLFVTSILLISCIDTNTNDKTHIVSVHNEHEELINNYFVKDGELFDEDLLETLIPKGETFTFKFWSIEIDGEKFLFTTPITNNLNLYPVIEGKVEPKPTYTVTVLGTSGEEIGKYTVDQGNIFEKSMIEGHLDIENHERFDKWVIDGTSTEFTFGEAVTGNITIRAKLLGDPNAEFDVTLYNGYYSNAEGMIGDNLLYELRSIISSYTHKSYGDAREILIKSDADLNREGYIYLIYDGKSIKGIWDSGATWNREHVWPDSKLNGASRSDLHNLRASTTSVNGSRGNDSFSNGAGTYGSVSGGWYPGDDHKGDVARIIFYMITRYSQLSFNTMGNLNMFLEWHYEDPVDDFERNRNEVIFNYQKNRNPYIDYPDLVDVIWGDQIN